jgi:hypothetical protein
MRLDAARGEVEELDGADFATAPNPQSSMMRPSFVW